MSSTENEYHFDDYCLKTKGKNMFDLLCVAIYITLWGFVTNQFRDLTFYTPHPRSLSHTLAMWLCFIHRLKFKWLRNVKKLSILHFDGINKAIVKYADVCDNDSFACIIKFQQTNLLWMWERERDFIQNENPFMLNCIQCTLCVCVWASFTLDNLSKHTFNHC